MNKFVPNCGVWMSPNAVDRFERLNRDAVSGEVTQSTFEVMSDMIRSTITSFFFYSTRYTTPKLYKVSQKKTVTVSIPIKIIKIYDFI